MLETSLKWTRKFFHKVVRSIAFVPALFGIGFFILAIISIQLDANGFGEKLNQRTKLLVLDDAETARTIVATIVTSIISLTVFSFSMVMIVMSQATSQMSNRMLDNFIGDRVQKWVLGFYIGTIIYGLFLLTNINSSQSQSSVPILSIYFLILVTILDIFLFAYFLHYITQSFRYEQLIQRIHDRTYKSFKKFMNYPEPNAIDEVVLDGETLMAPQSGYFQGFALERLMKIAVKHNIVVQFLQTEGSYILKGTPLMTVNARKNLGEEALRRLFQDIDFYYGQEIDNNPYYGFQHLTEVGVKALSPGINDPGTAVLSLNALADLLSLKMDNNIPSQFMDDKGQVRIITKEMSFENLFINSICHIWDYGKDDRMVQKATARIIDLLRYVDKERKYYYLFDKLAEEVKKSQCNSFEAL